MCAAPLLGFGMPGFGMPGYQEMIVILIVGLLIFGRRLPEVGRTIGKTVVQLRKGLADFKEQIRDDEDLRDVKATVHDFQRAVDAPRNLTDPTRLLEHLTELIIPADETPGAREAGVSEFIDFMAASDPSIQYRFRYGLLWLDTHSRSLHRRPFREITAEQQRAILEGLDTIPWAPTCPHGRPVAVALDRAELEQRFRRR